MSDVHTKEIRSFNMSMIKGKNTSPEVIVRKYLFSMGYRYRLHYKELPGKPDIVLPRYGTVLFVHGCFWHGHEGCKYFVVPKTRTEWWLNKINSNKLKDNINNKELKKLGWHIITVWECDLKSNKKEKSLAKVNESLKKIKMLT